MQQGLNCCKLHVCLYGGCMFAYMVVLLTCCWDISGCAWGVSLKEGQRRWLEWCLAIPPHGKRGPANESEPWTERTVVTVRPHKVTLYFRNITDPWMSAQPEKKWWRSEEAVSDCVFSTHPPVGWLGYQHKWKQQGHSLCCRTSQLKER